MVGFFPVCYHMFYVVIFPIYLYTSHLVFTDLHIYAVAVKIVRPPVGKRLFLLQLRNESHCRFPTFRKRPQKSYKKKKNRIYMDVTNSILRNKKKKFPTYLLLKLIILSVPVLSFRPNSIVVQVLLKEKKNTWNFSSVKILQPT